MDGRYAPSPTGPLHVGNLRTALLAWLFARSAGSCFRMRIEDLDTGRSRREHEEGQLADLAAIGIDWDGEILRQSERSALYEEAVEVLRAQGLVYECWCTRAEIRAAASAPHGDLPEGAYPGTCRDLTASERAAHERSGRPAALRVRAGEARVTWDDVLLGPGEGVVDDLVLRRGDGAYAYNLAVVVDDDAQGVEEVVRGSDLASTTQRQVWLAERLGVRVPRYAHVPLVLGPGGRRLSKRDGDVTLGDRLARGETADDVRGALAASVGLWPAGETPTAEDLVRTFDPMQIRGDASHVPLPGIAGPDDPDG